MGDEEELTEQQKFQKSVERRFTEETQARNAMEKQLESIHRLLGRLVGGNHDGQIGVTGTPTSSNSSPSDSTPGMLDTLPQSSRQPTVTGSIMQPVVSFARSSAYTSVPKISEGMQFLDYKQKVKVWRKLVSDTIPAEKQGLLLLGELPLVTNMEVCMVSH